MDFFALKEVPPIVKTKLRRSIEKKNRLQSLPQRLVQKINPLFNSDYFQFIDDALNTIKLRYNFGEEFDISYEFNFDLEVFGESNYKSFLIGFKYIQGESWKRQKGKIKEIIKSVYIALRPGGIFVPVINTKCKFDIPLQIYTFSIGEMFVPLEKIYVDLGNELKIIYVFAKLFYQRRKDKYALKRAFHHQPYNLCTKSISELERSFHPLYSAFQYKSTIKWLEHRLNFVKHKEKSVDYDYSGSGENTWKIYKNSDPWNESENFQVFLQKKNKRTDR